MKRAAFVVDNVRSAALRALNYEPTVERVRRSKRGRTHARLGDLASRLGAGYATVFARIDCDTTYGVELLSQSDMFAAEPQGRVIRADSMKHPDRHKVRRGHVLIAGAGTLAETELYGRAIIADNRLAGKYVGQDTLVVEFPEPDDDVSLYTYAYLASPTGFRALRSASYGTKILRIRRDVLADIPVPLPDEAVRRRVAVLIRTCVEQRETYLRELKLARRAIEALPEMRQAHAMCAERTARAVTWGGEFPTISAWTFASTGGAREYLLERWGGRLRDAIEEDGVYNGPRFARVPCNRGFGLSFMSQRDAFLIRPVPRSIVHPGFSDRLLFAPCGTIMVGGHGTLGEGEVFGRAMLVYGQFSESAFTQDLLRVLPRAGYQEVAYAYMTTLVGMRLLRSTAVGTKILSMRLDLLRDLPFPEMDSVTRAHVIGAVNRSGHARALADAAEAEAIRIVEEEVLPTWLA